MTNTQLVPPKKKTWKLREHDKTNGSNRYYGVFAEKKHKKYQFPPNIVFAENEKGMIFIHAVTVSFAWLTAPHK